MVALLTPSGCLVSLLFEAPCDDAVFEGLERSRVPPPPLLRCASSETGNSNTIRLMINPADRDFTVNLVFIILNFEMNFYFIPELKIFL